MFRSLPEKLLIASCCLCIVLTIFLKSELHEITRPDYDPTKDSNFHVDSSDIITIHYHERRPYYVNYQGEVHGLVADPVKKAFEYADIPATWQETPAKRQLSLIRKNEERSCAVGWFKTPYRESFAQYSLPVYRDNPLIAITRVDNNVFSATEDVEQLFANGNLRLLIKEGYSYGTYIDQLINKLTPWQIATTGDNLSILKMIESHRADYCFMTEEEAHDILLFSGLTKSKFKTVRLSDVPLGNKRYVICTKKVEPEILDRLNQAISFLTNPQGDEQ